MKEYFKGWEIISGHLFKISIIIIGVIYLILYYNHTENRRYILLDKADFSIMDTRTGIIYLNDIKNDKIVMIDQINGILRDLPLKVKTRDEFRKKDQN